jgi:hypothetical protein
LLFFVKFFSHLLNNFTETSNRSSFNMFFHDHKSIFCFLNTSKFTFPIFPINLAEWRSFCLNQKVYNFFIELLWSRVEENLQQLNEFISTIKNWFSFDNCWYLIPSQVLNFNFLEAFCINIWLYNLKIVKNEIFWVVFSLSNLLLLP